MRVRCGAGYPLQVPILCLRPPLRPNSHLEGRTAVASYTGARIEHPQAQTVFILSIVGIFTGICAPIAWYMGVQAKKEIAAQPGQWSSEGNLKTGTLIGKIFTILYIIGIVVSIVFMILGFALMGIAATSYR